MQPREGEFTFAQLDQLLDFADANDLDVYGQLLFWHSQTPAWFFKDGDRDLTNSPADHLFAMLPDHAEAVDSVTFWGISNARSWLRTWPTARPYEQPLPFDDDLQAAPAYWGTVDPTQLPARPEDVLPPRIAGRSDIQAVSPGKPGVKVDHALPSTIDTGDG